MQAPTSLRRIPKLAIIHEVKDQRTLRPIEALAESGSLLNRRIWLILLPIGLDLLIWLAPRIILGEELFPLAEGSTSAFDEGTDSEDPTIFSFLRQSNLLSLVIGVWVPSLGISASGDETGAIVVLKSLPQLLMALALLLPLSFILGSTYLALIASEMQQRTSTWEVLVPRVLRLAMRLGGLVGIMLVVTVVPFAIASLLLSVVPLLGFLLFLLALILLMWIVFYAFFIVDSLALVRQSLPKVVRLTLDLIHSNPWPAVGFFCLYWLIVFGTSLIWSVLLDLEILNVGIGRIIASIGNAYVGTWVTIAMFMYVWNRLLIHQEEPTAA